MRRAAFLCALGLSLTLGGCSGSLFIGVDNRHDGPPPTIALTATPSSLTQAGTLTLGTSITASAPLAEVRFYQTTARGAVLLGTRTLDPFQFTLAIDRTSNGTLAFYATAIDANGQSADSATITVVVAIP